MIDVTQTTPVESSKKVLIETWGCQMNVADSEHMLGLLKEQNYSTTEDPGEADLVLLNTCHIREKAKHKVLSRLGRLAQIKERRPHMRIAVAGCVAQAEGKKILKEAPMIDLLLSPSKIADLPDLLKQQETTRSPAISIGFEKHAASDAKDHQKSSTVVRKDLPTLTGKNEVSRYVNIMQGCDNFCTFCIVPFTRGREISRMPREVYDEVQMLVRGGAQEITLLGQNVNSYGNDLLRDGKLEFIDDTPFVQLLTYICTIPELKRVRFTTSNPHDFSNSIANLFASEKKLGKYIHLPVQSGSDAVLEKMKRKVTVAEYMERIKWLRSAHPDMAISTDLIVGFPGETEEDFLQTLELVRKVRFSFVFCFKYSPRSKTAAARFSDQIPESVMDDRLARLNELQNQITAEENEKEIGQTREVLVLYPSKKEDNIYYGRTEHYRLVRIYSKASILGQLVRVKVNRANKTTLEAVVF